MPASVIDVLRSQVFVTAPELRVLLVAAEPPLVLEAVAPADRADRDGARQAALPIRVPGSVTVRFPEDVAGAGGGTRGRQPLPEIAEFQRTARRWGLRAGQAVVVYGDRGPAARAWWVLRWAGVADVRLLDGGIAAWVAEGYQTSTEASQPPPGDVELQSGHLPVLDADGAARVARTGVLLDARGLAAYRGTGGRADDPRSGHIPGAVSAPTDQNLSRDGRVLAPEHLQQRFSSLGALDPDVEVGVYCGGGVAACHEIAVLASLGREAALYPGSWSAWSADPQRPVASGVEPQ